MNFLLIKDFKFRMSAYTYATAAGLKSAEKEVKKFGHSKTGKFRTFSISSL